MLALFLLGAVLKSLSGYLKPLRICMEIRFSEFSSNSQVDLYHFLQTFGENEDVSQYPIHSLFVSDNLNIDFLLFKSVSKAANPYIS
jgi:hypothetical protein